MCLFFSDSNSRLQHCFLVSAIFLHNFIFYHVNLKCCFIIFFYLFKTFMCFYYDLSLVSKSCTIFSLLLQWISNTCNFCLVVHLFLIFLCNMILIELISHCFAHSPGIQNPRNVMSVLTDIFYKSLSH